MNARPSWKAIFYGADVDAAATARQSDTVAAVAALTGYVTQTVYITKSVPDWEIVFAELKDVSGAVTSSPSRRRTFKVECFPFQFIAHATDQDIDDKDALAAIFDKSFAWVRIEMGTRTYPAAAAEAHPIYVTAWNPSDGGGKHKLTIDVAVRYPV